VPSEGGMGPEFANISRTQGSEAGGRRGSNSRPLPWQGTVPILYSRAVVGTLWRVHAASHDDPLADEASVTAMLGAAYAGRRPVP